MKKCKNKLITEYIHYAEDTIELSELTIKNYLSDLAAFEDYMIEKEINILTATEDNLEKYLLYLKNEEKLASSTRTRKLISLRGFYSYLLKKKYINENPTENIDFPPRKKRNPSYLTVAQAKKMLDATEDEKEPLRSRDRAILTLFLTTGLRANELREVKISDITEKMLSVIGKRDKQREVGLNKDALKAIQNYLKIRNSDSEYLFISNRSNIMSKRTIQKTVKKYMEKAGLDTNKYSTHSLRHSFATIAHKNGVSIRSLQAVLGHSSINTTEIYTHIDTDQKQAVADNLEGIF